MAPDEADDESTDSGKETIIRERIIEKERAATTPNRYDGWDKPIWTPYHTNLYTITCTQGDTNAKY